MCYRFEFQEGTYFFMIKTVLDRIMEHKIQLRIVLIYDAYKKVNKITLIISFQYKLHRKREKYFSGKDKTDCISTFHFSTWNAEKIKCDFIMLYSLLLEMLRYFTISVTIKKLHACASQLYFSTSSCIL